MASGTVKFFDTEHDYGFIRLDDGGEEVPAHRSDFGSGVEALTAGQRVSFEIVEGREGKVPTNIKPA